MFVLIDSVMDAETNLTEIIDQSTTATDDHENESLRRKQGSLHQSESSEDEEHSSKTYVLYVCLNSYLVVFIVALWLIRHQTMLTIYCYCYC